MKIDKRKYPRSKEIKDKIRKKLEGKPLNHNSDCQCFVCKAKRNAFRKLVTKKCLTCGNEFQTKYENRKFCSRKCYWNSGINHPLNKKIKANCAICGKVIYKLKNSNKKYCSVKCQRIGHSLFLKELYSIKENHPCYIDGRASKLNYCIDCGEEIHVGATRCKKCYKLYWEENILPYMKRPAGVEHSNWQGGISKEPYPFEFDNELKEKIRKRDKYQCQICGITEEEHLILYGADLNIHHKDYNKKNIKEGNLTSLCNQCHGRTNFNRNYWKEYFNERYIKGDKYKIDSR